MDMEEPRTFERSDGMCLFYDLCVTTLVDGVLKRGVFLAGLSGNHAARIDAYNNKRPCFVLVNGTEEQQDECVASLACPLLRARPDMNMQLEALRLKLSQLSDRMPDAKRWYPYVDGVVCATTPDMQKWAIVVWAEEDPGAHAAQICALYAALWGIRHGGQQGLSTWGLPPSLRQRRFYEFWRYAKEDDHAPHTAAEEPRRLFAWFSSIIKHERDTFWPRVDRYIAFVENEWLGGEVRRSPPLRNAVLQYLQHLRDNVGPPYSYALEDKVRALVTA
jgi:hypothetical protein